MPKFIDRTGMVYGRLTVIAASEKMGKSPMWLCRCECGAVKAVHAAGLVTGDTVSCGCLRLEKTIARSLKHGLCRSTEHRTWVSMRERCNNTHWKGYKHYGGRGITVCERWKSFENFLEDMGERPEGMSLDRIDNDGNYEPANCRWATRREQNNNKRGNVKLEIGGVTKTLTEWGRSAGLSGGVVAARLRRGWSKESVLLPKCHQAK